MNIGVWIGLVAAGLLIVFLVMRRRREGAGSGLEDTGAAIVEFGKAYPALPIRDVIMTKDRQTAFLRLADGRTGMIEASGRHYLSRLVMPGSVDIEGTEGDRALRLAFRGSRTGPAVYAFDTAEEAAEVSLWLVETLLEARDGHGNAGTAPLNDF